MQFALRRFLQGENVPHSACFSADMAARDFAGQHAEGPVECTFSARRTADGADLALAVRAAVTGECARCLEPARKTYDFTCGYSVRPRDLEDPDFELPLTANGCLDVEELAYQELFLALPRVLLCSPDCPGLCPVCGNRKDRCTCAPTAGAAPADDRLSILQDLLR